MLAMLSNVQNAKICYRNQTTSAYFFIMCAVYFSVLYGAPSVSSDAARAQCELIMDLLSNVIRYK